ncbi:hypothetical protein FDB44_02360 [Clostridium botulinum]|uniref:hypothetical protein n=2 Tax=Clostridium TaxID=1485 RepID=UPI000B285903|nr:hypothetical protein [Clostridium botulinum]NFG57485.1 hypothetical protein [Clostridium botulinum]NFL82345.1 hypothetical protein [Clostridium botulinum]NFN11560.1 hypothetical protein [Clostridium botulinum]NFO36455.1 hypothetical protein [Clostridium botulinum]NFO43776.1 hypothetical protein [Clostridium botulinum]
MIEITYLRQMENVQWLPVEVQDVIKEILEILDPEYGVDRDKYADDGGYVVVVENIEDFKEIHKKINIDINDVIVEYVDKILCADGKVYTNSLALCNNDYYSSIEKIKVKSKNREEVRFTLCKDTFKMESQFIPRSLDMTEKQLLERP